MDYKSLQRNVTYMEEKEIVNFLTEYIKGNHSHDDDKKVITSCLKGLEQACCLFEIGEYFISDLVYISKIFFQIVKIIKPVPEIHNKSTIVLGTVSGDVHDIGKNIFGFMLNAAGFNVIDLGIDLPTHTFVNVVLEKKPDILGLSGLLTLSLKSMKDVVNELNIKGVKDSVKIIIGGNFDNEDCNYVGADAYAKTAIDGLLICENWINSINELKNN